MRARAAYISSFGTTSILVAAALLLLATVGAFVAFNGWPGSASDESVTSLPLAPAHPRPVKATRDVHKHSAPATARRSAPARASRTRPVSTAGLVKVAPAPSSPEATVVKRPETIRLNAPSPPRSTPSQQTMTPSRPAQPPRLPDQPVVPAPDVGAVVEDLVDDSPLPPPPEPLGGDTQQPLSDLQGQLPADVDVPAP